MSRPLRIEYENAYYHVMNRGRDHDMIFHGEAYYEAFLETLSEAHTRFGLEIHAYCLMGNHYHLLVKTPEGNLQRAMRHVSGVYTQRYNRLKQTDGSLFKGRYKSILIDADAYLLQLSRYIHRNPLEANMVRSLSEYPWSSYPFYIGKPAMPGPWLYTEEVYGQLCTKRQKTTEYQAFVEEAIEDDQLTELYAKARIPPVYGDERFALRAKTAAKRFSNECAYTQRQSLRPEITDIVNAVGDAFDVPSTHIFSRRKGRGATNLPRRIAMYLCQHLGGHRLTDIANAFSLAHYGGVSNAIYRAKLQIEQDSELQKKINTIMNKFDP